MHNQITITDQEVKPNTYGNLVYDTKLVKEKVNYSFNGVQTSRQLYEKHWISNSVPTPN